MHEKNIRFYNREILQKIPGAPRDFCYHTYRLFFLYIFYIQDIESIPLEIVDIMLRKV